MQPHNQTEGVRYLLAEREEEAEALRNSPPPPGPKPQEDVHKVRGVKGTLIGRAVGRAMFHGAGDGQAIKRRVHLCHIAQQQERGIIGEGLLISGVSCLTRHAKHDTAESESGRHWAATTMLV